MELEIETGWQLHPIGGDTGQAYMGTKDEKRLFLKRNSSPFLAALSLEGISPKLVWTKRIGNGDVLTAQEWCNGRTLYKKEMKSSNVTQIVQKVHLSKSLKRMLHRLGGKVYSPIDFYRECVVGLDTELIHLPVIDKAITYLKRNMPEDIDVERKVVCHGDISHKNLLLTNEEELFLVDWDSTLLADPLFDVSQLLERYIPYNEWKEWLKQFNYVNESKESLRWYSIINILLDIKIDFIKQSESHLNKNIMKLNELLSIYE